MKTHKAVLALSLAALVGGMLAPAAALADGGQHGGPRPHGGRHLVTGPGHRPGHVHQHRHFHRPFVPRVYPRFPYSVPYVYGTGYYAPPAFYGSSLGYGYGLSAGYDPPIAYASPPAYGPPPAYGSPPPVAPTGPRVIEYPTGRYELRGDGNSTPYVWVWIPNAPPPPESAPESPSATKTEPPPPTAASDALSPRRSQFYRWVDEQGVVHLTDNPESVPAQYRKPAAPAAQGGAS
jgi:Domain of unknown function (DUF4124)